MWIIYLFSSIAPWFFLFVEHRRGSERKMTEPVCYSCSVPVILFQLIKLSLNKVCVFIIWIICVSLLFAWYDFILYFVSFHSPDVPTTLLPTTIIPSLTTAPVTTTVAITTSPSTSASSSSRRGTVCFFVIAPEAQPMELCRRTLFRIE